MKFAILIIILLLSFSLQSAYSQSVTEPNIPENTNGIIRMDLIRYAKIFLGIPYRRAGSNPKKGFDCSGFVNYVFKNFKIKYL